MTSDDVKNLSPDLEVLDIKDLDNQYIITVKSTNNDAKCPFCGTVSNKVHQKYTKSIQDLPINNKDVILKVKCRIFRCDNKECDHFSFNEQFDFVNPLEKKTNRLIDRILILSKDNTCRGVAKILNSEGVIISKATVNNIYKKSQ